MEEFTKEYVLMWKKWNDFEGKSTVREYWMPVLIGIIISIIFGILGRFGQSIAGLYNLAVLVPTIALFIRRMHDTGRSGWYWLWLFLPIVGWIIVLLALIQKG
ncbi:MAG: DUF805 domain-containing protein [Firmicutes bacterium]|nr:DUF805 domain-containing protein [Bacillota bacterium]